MGQPQWAAPGRLIYYVLNRALARFISFENQQDYEAFDTVLTEAVQRSQMRLLSYCDL